MERTNENRFRRIKRKKKKKKKRRPLSCFSLFATCPKLRIWWVSLLLFEDELFSFVIGSIVFCVVVGATIGFSLLAGDWTSIREELVSDVVIEHNHGVVWDVLTGVDDFDDWSSTIDEVKGNLTTGQHVRVTFRVFPFVSVPMEVLSRFEYSSLRIAFLEGIEGSFLQNSSSI
jgi:hypothetical protein